MNKQCQFFVFYELHNDPMPAQVILKLLPMFKYLKLKAFALEAPEDLSVAESITMQHQMTQNWQCICNAESLTDLCVESYLIEHPETRSLSNNNLLAYMKWLGCSLEKSYQQHLELLIQLQNTDIDVYHVDYNYQLLEYYIVNNLLGSMDRNQYITNNLIQCCHENIAFLTGVNHQKVAVLLRNKGYDVREYYVADHAIPTNIEMDKLLREDTPTASAYRTEYFYGIVIDVHKDPALNATAIIGKDILNIMGEHYNHDNHLEL